MTPIEIQNACTARITVASTGVSKLLVGQPKGCSCPIPHSLFGRLSLSPVFLSILPRSLAGLPAEHHGEITLVAKAQQGRDLRDRPVTDGQKLFGGLDALSCQVFSYGQTGVGFEQAAKMIWTEAHSLGNVLGTDLLGQMVRQVPYNIAIASYAPRNITS